MAMTRALCKEMALLAPGGAITVNAIAPGLTFSEATLSIIGSPEMAQPYLQNQTISRQETPDDLAGAVLYMCSDASDFMSGHIMVVDGGVSLY
jgi:NAD(P)-dependent dehydrogenase (short-subunit alcohol dehydrogenase family)